MEETRSFRAVFENPGSEAIEAELGLWLSDVPPPSDLPHRYDLEVEYVDGVFGSFIDELKRIGRFEDSLIVFTSDHGEGLGDHGEAGHGKILYNEQVHVPLIIKAPAGHLAADAFDAERDQLVSHMDLVPTALDVLELPSLPGQRGTSLLVDSERLSISESHFSKELGRIYAIRDGRYVLMYGVDSGLFALFDTLEDPGEEVDIFASRGHEFEAWQQVLREIGAGALDGLDSVEELTSESRELLRGLGYTDGDE
jgi:arylsulfatase A-like enzyme